MTVVGSSCSIPRPARACSSYLFEAGEHAIVADLGSGAFGKLLQFRSAESIDAIVISHMHADHFLDVIPMRYALKYGRRTNDRRVVLYLPPEGDTMLKRLAGAFVPESPHDFIGEVFDVRTYDADSILRVGDATLRFAPTSHYIATFALRCEYGASSVTYSADTSPDERVTALAREANALLCEATLATEEEVDRPRGHVSAREAGLMASQAAVGRLVLTHYPHSADVVQLEASARAEYDGPVTVADDG
ncbi:MAG: MBL fold metallo-hydrolase, partial [Candidatus Eremiobacteraeota bacterium]|nr:MBL fold metallo-hydrolase [Candidatus Eremiobacteraeota bacterium]